MKTIKYYDGYKKQETTINIGDIFYDSWGYDQTQYDFFKVKRFTKHYVVLDRLTTETLSLDNEYMTSKVVPGEPTGHEKRLKFTPYFPLFVWEGKPKTETHGR